MSAAPLLSLVTGTLNRPESFKRLLDSIVKNTSVPWELIVSDASDRPYALELPENVLMLPERPRLGCVKGFNRAFLRATGEWVIYLNDDAEVQAGYAEAAIGFMTQHPSVGLGALHYADRKFDYRVNLGWGMVYANFGIIRRELGNSLLWFDDDLQMYGNDNSLTFRVLIHGLGIGSIPEARIFHHSVQDQLRIDNQHYKQTDNKVITQKYMPLRNQMLAVYSKNRHLAERGTVVT
jgi:GT2 family glycosyltransferase